MGTSIIEDSQFDKWARELVKLQNDHPDVAAQVDFHKSFIGFDGTTGFDLPYTMPQIVRIADRLIAYERTCHCQQKFYGEQREGVKCLREKCQTYRQKRGLEK
jgi:hypothetical protein